MSKKKSSGGGRKRTPKKRSAEEIAHEAGQHYVQDQLSGDFFRDWVWDQMIEAEEMRKRDPSSVIPLESRKDYDRLARNMLQQLGWDIDRDLRPNDIATILNVHDPSGDELQAFHDGMGEALSSDSSRDWLVEELIMPIHEEIKGQHAAPPPPPPEQERLPGIRARDAKRRRTPAQHDSHRRTERAARFERTGRRFGPSPSSRPPTRQAGEAGTHRHGGPTNLTVDKDLAATRIGVSVSKTLSGAVVETWKVHPHGDPMSPVLQVSLFRSPDGRWNAWGGEFSRAKDRSLAERVAAARNSPEAPQTWAEEGRHVRDYIAVDNRDRQIAGPFKDYGEAKAAADRAGGYVRFQSKFPPAHANEDPRDHGYNPDSRASVRNFPKIRRVNRRGGP